MNQLKFGVLIVVVLWVSACSEPIDNPKCSLNSECQSGLLCNPEGVCVQAEGVSIQAVLLSDALSGEEGYKQALGAEGGIPPYTWTLSTSETKLGWLEIDEATGGLRAKAGQMPGETGRNLRLEVTVRDRSEGGVGATASRPFGLSVIECRGSEACYEESGEKCLEGEHECVEGMLTAECESTQPSADVNHCGPGCGECGDLGDRCEAGECRCGSRDPCVAGEMCCGTGCYELTTDTANCGGCGVDCGARLGHVTGAYCEGGECDYVSCAAEYHDCDGSRRNGCETQSDRSNCGACGDDCASASLYPHTEDQSCEAEECEYACEEDYADCEDPPSGCETQLGTGLNCGSCGEACTGAAAPACISVTGGGYTCGCTQDGDCAADRMCCDSRTCVIHSANNCESCGHKCTILEGGLECLGNVGTGWSCGCEDTVDCQGAYSSFSLARCSSSEYECYCSATENCAGTVEDMCCETNMVNSCTDLTTDSSNCGVCGRICDSGSCVDGTCTCGVDDCPNQTGEDWDCVGGSCVCPSFSNEPCYPGQYCCLNKGCCMDPDCGDVALADCSTGCFDDDPSNTWCRWGCCSSCADETECGMYEPEGFPFYP